MSTNLSLSYRYERAVAYDWHIFLLQKIKNKFSKYIATFFNEVSATQNNNYYDMKIVLKIVTNNQ